MLQPGRSATRSRSTPTSLVLEMVLTDSITAQLTRTRALPGDPSPTDVGVGLVVLGRRPAQQVSFEAEANQAMSSIAATRTAARLSLETSPECVRHHLRRPHARARGPITMRTPFTPLLGHSLGLGREVLA